MQKITGFKVGSVHTVGGLDIIKEYPYNSDYATVDALGWNSPASAGECSHNWRQVKKIFTSPKYTGYLAIFRRDVVYNDGREGLPCYRLYYLDSNMDCHRDINGFAECKKYAVQKYYNGTRYTTLYLFGIIGDVKKDRSENWRNKAPYIKGVKSFDKNDMRAVAYNNRSRRIVNICYSYDNYKTKEREREAETYRKAWENKRQTLKEKRDSEKVAKIKVVCLRYMLQKYNRAELIRGQEWETLANLQKLEKWARDKERNRLYTAEAVYMRLIENNDLVGAIWYI